MSHQAITVFERGAEAWAAIQEAAGQAQTVLIGVAYVTADRVKELEPLLKDVTRKKSGQVRILCGIGDENAQEPAALEALLGLARKSKRVTFGIVAKPSGLFHPKLYFFDDSQTVDIFVGSSNLTGPAFSTNVECNVRLSFDARDPVANACRRLFDGWASEAKEPSEVVTLYKELSERKDEVRSIEEVFKKKLAETPPVILPPVATVITPEEKIAALASTGGYICDVTVSDRIFRISIPSEVAGRTGGWKRRSSHLYVIEQRVIHWWLLDPEGRKALQKIQNSVEYGIRDYGFQSPWGFFVPHPQFWPWLEWVKSKDEELQNFAEEAIRNLKGQERDIVEQFKKEFKKQFPKAPNDQITETAQKMRHQLTQLPQEPTRRRFLIPRWQPPSVLPVLGIPSGNADEPLRQFAQEVSETVLTRDLADFARAASRYARSHAASGLKPGSRKETCEELQRQMDRCNFYGDTALQKWCDQLRRVAARLPGPRTRLDKEQQRERRQQAKKELESLIQEAQRQLSEVARWSTFPPEKVLKAFVDTLTTEVY